MNGIFQKLAAKVTPMPIIDGKEVCLDSIFLDIQCYTHSILIIVSGYPLMSIHCIAFDHPVLLVRSAGSTK